jgi:hypothetical protein
MSRAPPTTSKSGKNASGQEAFVRKMLEMSVVESPAISAAVVLSTASGARATVASEVDKAETSAPPAAEGEDGDLTSAPHGRRRSSSITAMWRNSRRRHA